MLVWVAFTHNFDNIYNATLASIYHAHKLMPAVPKAVFTDNVDFFKKFDFINEIHLIKKHESFFVTKVEVANLAHEKYKSFIYIDSDIIIKKALPYSWFDKFWFTPYGFKIKGQYEPYYDIKFSTYSKSINEFASDFNKWPCSCMFSFCNNHEFVKELDSVKNIITDVNFPDELIFSKAYFNLYKELLPVNLDINNMFKNDYFTHFCSNKNDSYLIYLTNKVIKELGLNLDN